jgi:hypothetical protein
VLKPAQWPPPCPQCRSILKQQTEWSTDAQNFKQTCHECGYKGEWEPYPPERSRGWTYAQIRAVVPVRRALLLRARKELVGARKLSLHSPPLRDEIGRIISEVDECLSRLGP